MGIPSDAAVAAVWFVATVFLVCACWTGSRRLFPDDRFADTLAHTIVLGWAHLVAVATALGAAGVLTPTRLVAGVVGSAGVTLTVARSPGRAAGAALPAPRTGRSAAERWVWPAVWTGIFAFAAGRTITGGLLEFPTDWDTLMYHLPFVDQWLQARSLYAPDALRWSDPGNNELVTLWLVAPFSGDFLYGLTNLPATVLLGCREELARECYRVLRPDGRVVITVPSACVDPLLRLLIRLRLIDGMSLDQHHGFDPPDTRRIFGRQGFRLHHWQTFQFGLNHLFVFAKSVGGEARIP